MIVNCPTLRTCVGSNQFIASNKICLMTRVIRCWSFKAELKYRIRINCRSSVENDPSWFKWRSWWHARTHQYWTIIWKFRSIHLMTCSIISVFCASWNSIKNEKITNIVDKWNGRSVRSYSKRAFVVDLLSLKAPLFWSIMTKFFYNVSKLRSLNILNNKNAFWVDFNIRNFFENSRLAVTDLNRCETGF